MTELPVSTSNPSSSLSNGRTTTGVVSLLLAVLLFVAAVVLGFTMVVRMRDSVGWILHTYDVRSDIRALRVLGSGVAADVSSAAALDDPSFFASARSALDHEDQTIAKLRSLTNDNAIQQGRVAQLEPLIAADRAQLAACVSDLKCLPSNATDRRGFFASLRGRQEKTVALLEAMDDEEKGLLEVRLSAWSGRFGTMVVALAISTLSAVFLVLFNFRALLKEIDRRERSERLIREHVDSYRSLSGRILELQDIERRKLARELHDSVGQYLAGIKLQLAQLQRLEPAASAEGSALYAETGELLERCLSEVRTISHLLHPPVLDELGLYAAARWYVEGFAERSGLQVDFAVDDFVDRLHRDAEVALFRVLQEALTNVHRHSGASRVQIDISCKNDLAILVVKDNGRGIPSGLLRRYHEGHGGGIGLAGMRERLAELRGVLEVESSAQGTLLRASLPTNACRPARSESATVVV